MNRKLLCFVLFLIAHFVVISAITADNLSFLLSHGLAGSLDNGAEAIMTIINSRDCPDGDIRLVLEYAERYGNLPLVKRCHFMLAKRIGSLDEAFRCLQTASPTAMDSTITYIMHNELKLSFPAPADTICLSFAVGEVEEKALISDLVNQINYNSIIEDLAKQRIDEIAVERTDTQALRLIQEFKYMFPRSKWAHIAMYYQYYHLIQQNSIAELDSLLHESIDDDNGSLYAQMVFLSNSKYLEGSAFSAESNLNEAQSILYRIVDLSPSQDVSILYDTYSPKQWKAMLQIMELKIGYLRLLAQYTALPIAKVNHAIISGENEDWHYLKNLAEHIQISSNDRGELAELHFWRARISALCDNKAYLDNAAREYVMCLTAGAPRKRFDTDAIASINDLKERLGISISTEQWQASLMNYNGPTFQDITKQAGLGGMQYTRVAIGDYDNDGWPDILFNGTKLYRNNGNLSFTDVTEEAVNTDLNGSGGLWADFNKDGRLDFVSVSHAESGIGDVLMKNQENSYFVNVSERAGEIEDFSPTEGSAWVDIDNKGYPSLYNANYEKWQVQTGFPDYFWHNQNGYFSDQSTDRGIRSPEDSINPGLAGRGVAPADYDNDGQQEILVTNYRLCRNFAFDLQSDGTFYDRAFLDGLAGHYSMGYYGHSIGADWGDYDNDGDLDLFIANLAHPRYIEFSDISMLLRNDGKAAYMYDGNMIEFISFTDVTKQAGITYDELHSDPLWLDIDNDGWLDLFITSIYENDRSYMYHNNGDGTFSDITWLSGTRVFNGWGNATADLNRDGLTDLVVGSGNGVKILLNTTQTPNKSIWVKPVWKNDEVVLVSDTNEFSQYPNSPAFGTRVSVTIVDKYGQERTLIRELCSAKGTTSQNDQVLQFGIGESSLKSIIRVTYEKD